MKYRGTFLLSVCMVMFLLRGEAVLRAQGIPGPSRQKAMDWFARGSYEDAYYEFKGLLGIYSRDPVYKYYCGASLVELKKSLPEALDLLEQAFRSSTVVRVLPDEAAYYLGRARHFNGKYSEAITAYNIYVEDMGKKAARDKDIPGLIQQCKDKRGGLTNAELMAVLPLREYEKARNEAPVLKADTPKTSVNPPPVISEVPPVPAKDSTRTDIYEKLIDQAMEYRVLADSINKNSELLKRDSESFSEAEKEVLQRKLADNEMLNKEYKELADKKLAEAYALKPENKASVPADTLVKPVITIAKEAWTVNADTIKTGEKASQPGVVAGAQKATVSDTLQVSAEAAAKPAAPVTKAAEQPAPAISTPPAKEIFSSFTILPAQKDAALKSQDNGYYLVSHYGGKNWWEAAAKVPLNAKVPEGMVYRIQIAVFRNPVGASFFKGIAPVYGFAIEGTANTIYYAGMFRKHADAVKALALVKEKGFSDAFIVALSDNKRVAADKAPAMEKVWAGKPLFKTEAREEAISVADTLPPELLFRIEALRAARPLKEEALDPLRKIAAGRGLDISTLENGSMVYLIGKFITFESASEYSGLLVKNGYKDAKVVAFLGTKEIDVETAKKLFEGLK